MSTLVHLQQQAQQAYESMWAAWYHGIPGLAPARLIVELSSADPGYSHSANTLWVRVGEGNLSDPDDLDPCRWPVWRVQLIHEMLPEFQHKAVGSAASPAGRALYQQHQKTFFGPGHDDTFFTAIAHVAPHFRLSPDELSRWI